jgi:hypothetical protein
MLYSGNPTAATITVPTMMVTVAAAVIIPATAAQIDAKSE